MYYFIESVQIVSVRSLREVISPADQALADNLKLPLSFFVTKKRVCKGCVGCEYDSNDVSLKFIVKLYIYKLICYFFPNINLFLKEEEGEIDEHKVSSSKTDSEKVI